jgi:hypothetical protein
MDEPVISALTAEINAGERNRTRKYPINRLDCGQQFLVDNDADDAIYNSIRTAVSRYNKMHPDARVRTMLVDDGTKIKVYRDKLPGTPDLPITQPSHFEFVAYLQTLEIGKQAIFNDSYKLRFGQFRDWITALENATSLQYAIEINSDVMTVTRQPDYSEPVIQAYIP